MERNYNVFEKNKTSLWILFILSIVFLAIGAWTSAYESMLVAASTLILTLIALQKKDSLYIPPLFIVLLTAVMILVQISNRLGSGFEVLDIASDVLIGMFTCILGLMMLLAILRSSPEFDMEHPFFISFSAFCIGTAVSLFLVMVNFWIEELSGGSEDALRTFILSMTFSMLGSLVTAAAFYFNRHNGLFEHTLNRFIKDNADVLGVQDRAKKEILKEIEGGESSKLEFKSTLRTNLKTGEKDPRMEKAVLKTIVAFLNSRGGTLFIGVADDGTILGVDLASFENSKDKFGLHLNNLIKTQIGSEFLPFLHFTLVDFEDKSVMRVSCQVSDRPVFLTDGKEQIFYVRSGPSTIDLHGVELLYYANHNFGRNLKKHSP
jgi:hypothetical protein